MKTFISKNCLLVTILAIFLFHTTGIAQNKEEHKGKYAFQFQITPNFSLATFQGSVFSGKYNFTEDDAVRIGISINTSNNNVNTLLDIGNPGTKSTDINSNAQNNYGIELQYIKNNYLKNNLNFYFGGGPSFFYGLHKNNSHVPGQGYSVNESYSRSYGIIALAGIEWYFNKAMSLSAQYGIGYNYTEGIQNQSSGNGNIQLSSTVNKTTGFGFVPSNVLFGLTVYFK